MLSLYNFLLYGKVQNMDKYPYTDCKISHVGCEFVRQFKCDCNDESMRLFANSSMNVLQGTGCFLNFLYKMYALFMHSYPVAIKPFDRFMHIYMHELNLLSAQKVTTICSHFAHSSWNCFLAKYFII